MACSAASTALLSSSTSPNPPRPSISPKSFLSSQTLSTPSSFNTLRKSSPSFSSLSHVPCSFSSRSSFPNRRSFVVRAGIALRGLFIIDKEGVIQHATINNLAIGRSVDESLRTLQDHVASGSVATMPDTLHHLSTSSSITPPFITPKFPSLSRPKHAHLAPPPPQPDSNSISISIPSTAPPSSSSQENNNIAPPLKFQLLQEKLLYLDSLGLDSLYCLAAHSPILFTPLSQIKSLVKFLHSLGLTTPDLRRAFSMCPDLLATPLRTVLRPAVTFLLREAHVSGKDLRHVINRRPRLLICSVDRRLRPTLYFLRGTIGIDDVSRCAPLLSCCVESKFIPRLDYFLKLGIPKREAISLFRRFPSLFCYSIEENLEPKFNYFVVEMGRELRELVDFPHYFSFSLENRIKPRHKMCMERGVCLSLPVMLKSSEARFMDRLEVCCDSSVPLATSPLWCKRVNLDIDVT